MLDSISGICPPTTQPCVSRASSESCGLFFFSLVCDAAIRHLFRLPVLQWPAEEMALITVFNTGKHPAAPFPVKKAFPRGRRGSSMHATASSRVLPHHHGCVVKVNGFCFTRWPRCGSCRTDRERNPRRAKRHAREEHLRRLVGSITNTRKPRIDHKCAHYAKKCCARIKLWSKYSCRVTISLWPRA